MKYKRESWQTWSNYAHAAVQTQNYLQAARGILQVTTLLSYNSYAVSPGGTFELSSRASLGFNCSQMCMC